MRLSPELGEQFARVALSHVTREYPYKLEHILNGEQDLGTPRRLHPIFYGSFDWHSCVHAYWLLATLLRLFPDNSACRETITLFDSQFTDEKIEGEVAYLKQPLRGTFERPYGWAWLLMLAAELKRHSSEGTKRWRNALQPLAEEFVKRFQEFLPKATYPTRVGTHFNSAFGVALALEYANTVGNDSFRSDLIDKALSWYDRDVDCQAWEPGGDDFLSPALMEAECMRRALDATSFRIWIGKFLPRIALKQPATLFEPATVSDRTDGTIAHLDGLNLSRAWCWRSIAPTWGADDPRHRVALEASSTHLRASIPQVTGDYMGEHWLATFALLALI